MPEKLKKHYQNFTEANLMKLRSVGYTKEFTSLEAGISQYVNEFLNKKIKDMSRIIFNVAAKCDRAGRAQNQDNYWICPDLSLLNSDSRPKIGNDTDIELSEKERFLL